MRTFARTFSLHAGLPGYTNKLLSPAAWQTSFLFGVDGLTNLVDYGFHIYLAHALLPGDFAIAQTVNATLLALMTTFAVMQPVVARYITEAMVQEGFPPGTERSIFRYYFGRSLAVGLLLMGLIWWGQRPLATWLNVPPAAVSLSAFMLLLATVRPVVAGMLQGQHRFVAFGFTRSAYAVGRFVIGVVLISLGGGLLGAIAALPLGATLALLAGLSFLGWAIWRPGPALPASFRQSGNHLSGAAFVAYVAYMSLLSSDLIWVNRAFAAEMAGGYATAVLLRRILALLPGAVIVIMYPRAVAQVAQRKVPDKLLAQTAIVVLVPTLLLTLIYFLFGPTIIRWTFGSIYEAAAPLLGWMGLAMLGYGFTAIWLNFYLATRPIPFVALLALTAILHFVLLAAYHETLPAVTAIFALGGWLPALGGLLLYLLWLRPRLATATIGDRKVKSSLM